MMTEEQRRARIESITFRLKTLDLLEEDGMHFDVVERDSYRIALAALTQPASPALKLPDVPPNALVALCEQMYDHRSTGAAVAHDVWQDCIAELHINAPHTAPIEPICATGDAEWVSNERIEEIIYRAEMFGHGAGYLPNEVIPMAKELLALRKAFTQQIVWMHQTTGAKLNNSVIEDVRKQSGAWIPLYRKPNLPL